ncbi:TetR/AcrR family transcriptional regulator [Enterococcus sp. 669A]|uniref:TetR/AcrR family transcriptional regulator n=1 Tax=Candidatus Enterococcus moelleringii TaxID=2815325 RepID=A0ABS3LGF2_9ENTE|nr:TetR/AcrR family transcriptional regulator [Enterococcus sp. 669A]MBO1308721.1 TetR/AcrR family transcriptional regulator [Enterococcus sp. 669A]
MKNTRANIMKATKKIIIEKGYSAMTTKEIAQEANVNETTLFRQFGTKKELLMATLEEAEWVPAVKEGIADTFRWELKADLTLIMENYFQQVSPDIVRFSLGLRAQEIYQETLPYIQKIPTAFTQLLEEYLKGMQQRGKVQLTDPHKSAEVLFSSLIGFAFLHAYDSKEQFEADKTQFIQEAVELFVDGLE